MLFYQIALGDQLAGIFSNNDDLSNQLIDAGHKVDEKVWRLPAIPLVKDTTNMLIPTIADMHNVGKGGEASPNNSGTVFTEICK